MLRDLIHLNILVLRPSFSPALVQLLLFFSFSCLYHLLKKNHGAPLRAGPLSSARLFVLVLQCSPVHAYISRELMSRFFRIRAHANVCTCWHATATQTGVKVWSAPWLFCWVFFFFLGHYCVLDSKAPPFPCPWCLSGLKAALTRAPAGYRRGRTEGEKGSGRGSRRSTALETTRWGGNIQQGVKCRKRRSKGEGVREGKSVNKTGRAVLSGAQVKWVCTGQRNPGKYQPSVSLPPPMGPITVCCSFLHSPCVKVLQYAEFTHASNNNLL